MNQIIDRRWNSKNKSMVNRQRFLKRFKQQIKGAVEHAVSKRSITDIEKGEKVNIPGKDIVEPQIHHGAGGIRETVYPGNKEFVQGDTIKKPPSGGKGNGNNASPQGEGIDDFIFELSKKEFLELFFEDLELPELIKKQMLDIPEYKLRRAGYTNVGVPTNLNIVRTFKQATARRLALAAPYRKKLHELQAKLNELQQKSADPEAEPIRTLRKQIEALKNKIASFPFIDTFDLRYNNRIKEPRPSTRAVMFCLMDVSGSMDETKKDLAKRFFILLYLFLTRNYEHIELVFIRHHTSAKEVDEHEFFYSRETGGTVVSSALELMHEIIQQRYSPNEWNIYGAQASDGDNWNADSPYCQKLLSEKIMPLVQYFAYVEIMPRHHQSLWHAYLSVKEEYKHFAMEHIENVAQIYPVFRELFKRQPA